MSQEKKLELLKAYMELNIAPILVKDLKSEILKKDAIIIPATIAISQLNGHYENKAFLPPKWFQELNKLKSPILVIDDITSLSTNEQTKFIEILKYRKVGIFDLPKNCIIIISSNTPNLINEEIISLVAVI